MTDSTEHNKGFSKLLAEIYNLETPAGQIFCGTHTTLGFSSAMNKVMRLVEADMKMEQVLQSFMVDLDVDSKNASVAGQALDMCLKLVAPEYAHKPWNRYKEFLHFLEQKQNPHINNRLACLVKEVMELPYLKVVLVVFDCLGVHLVEPFYARTIEKDATHSQLREFYKGLHTGLGQPISDSYTAFITPEYPVVSEKLFSSVKRTYTEEVLNSVSDVAAEHLDEVKKLIALMQPHLKTVLARQRRDYGIDEETFPMDYPVSEQAGDIDGTPVHNIGMERQCGKVDYRLKKLEQKQEMAQRKERKRLDLLDILKSRGGPFTDSGEVEKFLVDQSLNNIEKLQRMKLEVQFARESTTLLPKADPIFRIQVTLASGKRRMKTAQEFGDALMAYLGKRSDRTTLEYERFQESL
uniref:Uncharacterized protein n=1 Tax=Knipowitschia caucasica TaxID=637954 RepID=A0AAV2MI12_KNICA